MLPRVQERPRRPREAHPADVEVVEPRPALVEDVLEPRQHALARARVALADEALDGVVRQPVNLDDDQTPGARRGGRRAETDEQADEQSHGPEAADEGPAEGL